MSDYVIVGAGSAGCALAAGLSAAGAQVTVLESGPPDQRPEVRVPTAFPRLFGTDYDWAYTTAPQAGLAGRELFWPRGRTLGGSSAINAQIWTRGMPGDYDDWDAPGWTDADLEPYFKNAEQGPVRLEPLRSPHPSTACFLAACAGQTWPGGYGPALVTQYRGRRWSAADAYLRPALRRPNLTVETGADVQRVLLSHGRAAGVSYRAADGTQRMAAARREVILAAGAVGSPVLLMRSGVGAGLPVPLTEVGRNLQDHLVVPLAFGPGTRAERVRASSNNAEALAFSSDLEFLWMPVPFLDHGRGQQGLGCTLAVVLLRPASAGRITLAGATPVIDPAYLSGPADLQTLLAGVRMAHHLLAQAALADWTGAPLTPAASDATDHAIRATAETLYHPVGTCRMGPVVDARLRVHGVDGLRVADLSVCPVIPRAHTQAAATVIGARAADLILEEAA
ncbi:MAG TPA: GMC family oxidoreductase N-terminal domain-containing protein [Streptosporangiaceae bacterium]|nr:GMC family oxidoreductase N-terminal domain-containing protein [Streptosporangiaceae bacterium]